MNKPEITVGRHERQRLPNRRGHELLDFEHGGISYTVGIGTALDVNVRDAAAAASLLLQHGCAVDTLRQALTRNGVGSGSGPLARALDLLAQ